MTTAITLDLIRTHIPGLRDNLSHQQIHDLSGVIRSNTIVVDGVATIQTITPLHVYALLGGSGGKVFKATGE